MTLVSVDNDFARFGAKSYAINKINSVEVRERQPHGMLSVIILALVGTVILMGALGASLRPDGNPAGGFILGIALIGFTYWQWQRTKIREYRLFLMTSSSETQAFVTRDADEVVSLRNRIETAMARHSQAGTDR